MMDQAKALAKTRGIRDRLICPGMTADPAAALGLLDVFLLTSKFEGTPNVVLEASVLASPSLLRMPVGPVKQSLRA